MTLFARARVRAALACPPVSVTFVWAAVRAGFSFIAALLWAELRVSVLLFLRCKSTCVCGWVTLFARAQPSPARPFL